MAAQTPQPLSLEAVMAVVTALQNQVQQTNQMLALVQQENATLAQVQQQMLAEIQNPFGILLHQGRLRRPQSEALNAVMDRFGNGGAGDTVLLVVHTGCGKSGIIALAPFYMQNPRPLRVLVIAPNVNIRDQLGETLRGGQRPRFLIERGLISPHQPLQTLPTVAVIDQPIQPVSAAQNHIIVANIQRLDQSHLAPFPRDQFDVVIVDEAHHYPAPSYTAVIDHFQNARRVFLTATPFRVDPDHPLPIHEDRWYTYTYTNAVHDGVIKEFEDIVTVDGEDLVGSVLDEVRRQLELLNNDNPFVQQNPLQAHQAIVFAPNTASANEIGDQCITHGLTRSVIHNGLPNARQLVTEFEHGTNQVAVVVGMMLEGYDNKRLSVAAFTYSITRLKKYIQAVGRVVRRSSSPEDRDNKAYVITHASLNIAQLHTKYMANEGVEANEELNDEDP